jgi:prepilin peptidase CpaA
MCSAGAIAKDDILRPGRGQAWLAAMVIPVWLGPPWVYLLGKVDGAGAIGTLTGLVVILLVATSTFTDLSTRKIPNWATYPALLWALAMNGLVSLGLIAGGETSISERAGRPGAIELAMGCVGMTDCLVGMLACFGTMILIYRLSGGGAGDVKLATALGAWLGLNRGLDVLVLSYLAAGIAIGSWSVWTVGPVALVTSLARRVGSILLPGWVRGPDPDQGRLLKTRVPLAAFFAIGVSAVLGGMGVPW